MKTPVCHSGVSASMVESSAMPMMTATMPPTSQRFHTPVALMIRPLMMLETSRPPTMQIDIRPASVGLMSLARWKYRLR